MEDTQEADSIVMDIAMEGCVCMTSMEVFDVVTLLLSHYALIIHT